MRSCYKGKWLRGAGGVRKDGLSRERARHQGDTDRMSMTDQNIVMRENTEN